MPEIPQISVVMPVRNEAHHLEQAFDALDRQSFPAEKIEVIVVDGGSSDGTVDVVQRRMATDPRVQLLGGPGVNTPLAMEVGRGAAAADLIAKVDGHGWINDRFIEVAVAGLSADRRVGCIGGRILPIATTTEEQAIAIARFSRFGVGGGVYTLSSTAGLTDTVQCGVYRREALDDAGGFDPGMAYGEDEEVNYRLRQRGWLIAYEPAMEFAYRVRPSIGALFRQYVRYGRARVAVVRRHPGFLRIKHAVPALAVIALLASIPALAFPPVRVLFLAVWGIYAGFVLAASVYLAVRHRFWRVDLIARSLAALHLGYGLGTLRGLFG